MAEKEGIEPPAPFQEASAFKADDFTPTSSTSPNFFHSLPSGYLRRKGSDDIYYHNNSHVSRDTLR